jgi:hypothetical protein
VQDGGREPPSGPGALRQAAWRWAWGRYSDGRGGGRGARRPVCDGSTAAGHAHPLA